MSGVPVLRKQSQFVTPLKSGLDKQAELRQKLLAQQQQNVRQPLPEFKSNSALALASLTSLTNIPDIRGILDAESAEGSQGGGSGGRGGCQ
eukprot:3214104-Rhodomonas_salina.1